MCDIDHGRNVSFCMRVCKEIKQRKRWNEKCEIAKKN